MSISNIQRAIHILHAGGLVAFPTETVYGLGADAKNSAALTKIFHAKNRPIDHPLIVHLADKKQLANWVSDISPLAQRLIDAFWPGPMTLIFKKATSVLDLVTGGQDTVGIRMPNHPVAMNLLMQFGGGLAAPSANRFGRISPTTAAAVQEELGAAVDLVLDGGQCAVGVESTIIDVSGDMPMILRPGMLSQVDIETILQQPIHAAGARQPSIRVSGSHESHYAPQTKTYLIAGKDIPAYLEKLSSDHLPMAFLLLKTKLLPRERIDCIAMPNNPIEYAHDLYLTLRELDKKNYKQIVVESVPATNEWDAIRDRLNRATKSF